MAPKKNVLPFRMAYTATIAAAAFALLHPFSLSTNGTRSSSLHKLLATMSKRSIRDYDAHLQPTLKQSKEQLEFVNPFTIMMAASKEQQKKQQEAQQQAPAGAAPRTVPCTHCSRQTGESHLRQCDHCQDVFCSTCSMANYDEREDRVFCLDCTASCQWDYQLPATGTRAAHISYRLHAVRQPMSTTALRMSATSTMQ
eukprot:gene13618-19495_t